MATIGAIRKTSNGCKAAKRVPRREAGFRVPSGNIAAIDFGTTNCSLAYVTVSDSFEEGPKRLPLNTTFYRVPTAILFTRGGAIDSFGYDARQQYLNLDDEDRPDWTYFEQIKMDLQHDENVSREMKVKAKNGKEYYLVDVIAQILKYLKNELIETHLKRGGHPLEATDFDWVITVPAIWRARGKQMMREAGYKAGLCSQETCGNLQVASRSLQGSLHETSPDKLSLALEPESAAIFCQSMSKELIATYCEAVHPFTASCYLVVDIGGGTVDISAFRVNSMLGCSIEIVHPPTGNDCGGSRVNKEFEKFLEKLVGDQGFSQYTQTGDQKRNAKHVADLNMLINNTFEKQKTIFGSKEATSGKMSIRLPYTLIDTYKVEIHKGLRQYSESEVKLVGQDLRVSYSKMADFFKPIVDGLLHCMTQTLTDMEARVETIYLVGGFGGCRYIHRAIQEKFGNRFKYVVPAEPNFAVVRGAVLFRRNPGMVHARRVDATYGIRTNSRFDPSLHDEEYKRKNDDNKWRCNNMFSTIVERGDVVSTSEVFKNEYFPFKHDQKTMSFQIFSSPEKDVWYTTGRGGKGSRTLPPVTVHKIGEFEVNMPILTGDKNRAVEVTFDFSHTEIQVKGYDRTSGNEVKVALDFISA